MADEFSQITQDYLYCHEHDLLDDEEGRVFAGIFEAGVPDDLTAQFFANRRSKHRYHQARHGIIPFKIPKPTRGDYVLGLDQKGRKIFSWIQFLVAHVLCIAGSGAGKTTACHFRILQIAKKIPGLWLFDCAKREFARLKPAMEALGVRLLVLPAKSMKINPLQLPRGVQLSDWVPRIADMLIQVLELPQRASKLLQVKLFALYGRFPSDQNLCPCLHDVFQEVKKDTGSNHQARMAILDALEPLLLSLGPDVLAYRRGWSSHDLAGRAINFQLAGCSETGKNLILNWPLLSEFTSRIATCIPNSKMSLYIVVDEAKRLCSPSNTSSAIAGQIGLIRGNKIGIDLSLQGANGLIPEIVSNTATKFLGRCGSGADYAAAGHSMGLTAEHIHWAQLNLKPGLFIAKLGEGPWRHPFIVRIPNVDLPVIEGADRSDADALSDLVTVPAPEYARWGMESAASFAGPLDEDTSEFDSPQEFVLCKAVVEHPMQASSTYPKLAGISSRGAKLPRKQIVKKGYIREHTTQSGGRGRATILLEPLQPGIDAVERYEERLCTQQ